MCILEYLCAYVPMLLNVYEHICYLIYTYRFVYRDEFL